MANIVIMPRQGQSVESCVITEWAKKEGDKVAVGDILFSYETDKSSFEEKSELEGTLLKILAEDGDDVPCLDPVAIIGNEGEDISSLIPKKEETAPAEAPSTESAAEAAPAAAPAAPVAKEAPATTATATSDGRIKISPRARHLAETADVDISLAVPTGPNGRIIERDINKVLDLGLTAKPTEVTAAAETVTATDTEYTDEKLSNVRKVIAKSMHASLSEMAQLTLNTSFDATKIMACRASIKAAGENMGLANITFNDMILFAVSKTILGHRALNAHYLDKEQMIRYFNNVNLGVAVDTDRGLLVPTVKSANKLSLNDLSKKTKELIDAARSGSISPDLLTGASFTVSNLGSMGIESFTPVVNPPQTAILGVDNITRRIKQVGGEDVFYSAMGLSLTFDHRALDGADAAKFLKDLVVNLENFDLLMAK